MKLITAGLTIGLVSLTALAGAATAADMPGVRAGGGTYGQAAVPVPAPVPYEEHYKWYIGGGVGFAARSSGNISASDGINLTPFEDQNGPAYGTLAFGRYLTPSLRLELSADFRAQQRLATSTPYTYQGRRYGVGPLVAVPVTATQTVDVESQNYNDYDIVHSEKATLQTNTFLLNAYYEFARLGSFRPYVGAGIGFAMNRLHRSVTEDGTCYNGGNTVYDWLFPTLPQTCHEQDDLHNTMRLTSGASATGIGFAGALMVGGTYDLSARTHLDVGYRLMYMDGKTVVSLPGITGLTTIDIGSRVDHELRTGIRFDLW